MSSARANTAFRVRPVISLATLVFVFVLPLHFHGPSTARIENECACIHGTIKQLTSPAGSPRMEPLLVTTGVFPCHTISWAGDWSTSQKVRGPPVPLSV